MADTQKRALVGRDRQMSGLSRKAGAGDCARRASEGPLADFPRSLRGFQVGFRLRCY